MNAGQASSSGRSASEVAVMVCVVLTLLMIAAVITYLIYRFVRRDMTGVVLIKDTRRLFNQSSPYYVDSNKLPVTTNGQEFSFSFWLYVADFQTSANHKLIFTRGSRSDLAACNPIVFMDATTNKMYISLATNRRVAGEPVTLQTIASGSDKFLTGIVEYVPLQRWVHVAFTVRDRLMTVFMDGEMYTVESVLDNSHRAVPALQTRPIISPVAGDVVVGAWGGAEPLNAYMGRFSFFNYALTQKDVQNIYNSGPRGSNVLGAIGMSDYGVRSPVYRLDSDS